MKIGYTTYPFTGLPGGMKRPAATLAKDPLNAMDVSASGSGLSRATLKYLQAIEQITSEIMNMTGDAARVEDARPVEQVPAGFPTTPVSTGPVITGNDVLIFIPSSPEGGEERSGELIVVKGMACDPVVDAPAGKREEGMVLLAGEIADKLRRGVLLLGGDSVSHDLSEVKDKFVVSVDTVDGVPIPSIIRHDPSGGTSEFRDPKGPGDTAVPAQVVRIASILAGLEEEGTTVGLPENVRLLAMEAPSAGEADDTGASTAESVPSGGVSFFSDPAAAAREIGRMVSRLFLGNENPGKEGQGKAARDRAMDMPEGPAGSSVPLAGLSRVVVTFVEPAVTAGPNGGALAGADDIAARMVTLTETINGFSAGSMPDMEDKTGDEPAAAAGQLPAREAMKQAAAASFAGVFKSAPDTDGVDKAKTFGMALDEKGFLTVDKAALRDSLSANKGEALRFIHDFASSLHDRISHNAYAFAGAYAGVDEAVLNTARGKDDVSGDDTDRKVEFEKRLNELQVLLKSSYELKDSFMQRKLAGREWLK